MADEKEDRTRQVEQPHGTDEVFEVGDSAIVEAPRNLPPPKPSPLPWAVAALAAVGAGALYLFATVPAQTALSEEKARADTLQTQVAALEDEKKKLSGDLSEKERLAATLAEETQKKDAILKEIEGTKNELEDKLKDEITRGDVLIKQLNGELVVDLADQILFPSGEAELNDKGKEVLRRVGETMLKVAEKVIQVGGHTDDQPISDKLKTKWSSNWELSTTRALNVVHYLEEEVKVPGERLVAAGFSQYRPVAKNKSKEGRKKNRRIEVILLPLKKK